MRGKIKKNALTLSLLAAMLALTFAITPAFSQGTTLVVSPSAIIDTGLVPDSTFDVDVTVHDVFGMLGYEFKLQYDTGVLTATDFATKPPFDTQWGEPHIDDALGVVEMAYSFEIPEEAGLDVYPDDPPFVVATISFTVDDWGVSVLDLCETKIPNVNGGLNDHIASDGIFSNIWVLPVSPYVALTAGFLESRHFKMSKDPEGIQTITGQIENKGPVTTTARVKFRILDSMGGPITELTTLPTNIAPGQTTRLSAGLNVGVFPKPASYIVEVQAEYGTLAGWALSRHGGITAAKTTVAMSFLLED